MEDEKKQKIDILNNQINVLNKEKQTLQDNCNHEKRKVKFENGTNTMKTYCEVCGKELGYPTKEEVDEFLK